MSTQIKKNGNWVTVAGGTRMWVGTKAALQAALDAGELVDGTAVMVTDDYEEGGTKYMQVPDWANVVLSSDISLIGDESGTGPNAVYTVPHSAPVSQIYLNPLKYTTNDTTFDVYINDRRILQNATEGDGGLLNYPHYAVGPVTVTSTDVVKIVNRSDGNEAIFQTVVVPLKLVEVTD